MLPLSIAGRTASRLALTNAKIAGNENPWASSYNKMVNSGDAPSALPQRSSPVRFSTASVYPPAPVSVLLDDFTGQNGTALTLNRFYDDSVAAYAQARRWVITGNVAHLNNAKSILNAWTSTLTAIQGKTDTEPAAGPGAKEQARLVASWGVPFLCGAADILRHWPGSTWATGDSNAFNTMMINIFLPKMDWVAIGNWSAGFAEARICIGVITENTTIFNQACDYWLDRLPRSVYMTSDGVRPLYARPAKMPPWPLTGGTQYAGTALVAPDPLAVGWNFTSDATAEYIDGLSGEAGRDVGHTAQGLNAWVRGAITAYHNGRTDLLTTQSNRLVTAVELLAAWVREAAKYKADNGLSETAMNDSGWDPIGRYNLDTGNPDGTGQPWVTQTGGRFKWGGGSVTAGWEYAYNELSIVLGNPMPNTEALMTGWVDGGTYGNLRGSPGVIVAGPVGVFNQFAWDGLDAIEPDPVALSPTAEFSSSATDLVVSFNASASTDPDGAITSYSWNFGDGTTGSGVSPSKTYAVAGTYTVTLMVTDNSGLTDTVSHTVTVSDPVVLMPPNAAFSNTVSGLTVVFNAEASSDSDGTIVSYSWVFGDSTSGSGVNPSKTYATAGTYTVTLTVTDNDGLTDTVSHSVTLSEPPPFSPPSAAFSVSSDGLSVDFDATASFDIDGVIESFDWDFGDGSSGTGITTSKVYSEAGTYTVVLTVTDNNGQEDSTSQDVTVAPTFWALGQFAYPEFLEKADNPDPVVMFQRTIPDPEDPSSYFAMFVERDPLGTDNAPPVLGFVEVVVPPDKTWDVSVSFEVTRNADDRLFTAVLSSGNTWQAPTTVDVSVVDASPDSPLTTTVSLSGQCTGPSRVVFLSDARGGVSLSNFDSSATVVSTNTVPPWLFGDFDLSYYDTWGVPQNVLDPDTNSIIYGVAPNPTTLVFDSKISWRRGEPNDFGFLVRTNPDPRASEEDLPPNLGPQGAVKLNIPANEIWNVTLGFVVSKKYGNRGFTAALYNDNPFIFENLVDYVFLPPVEEFVGENTFVTLSGLCTTDTRLGFLGDYRGDIIVSEFRSAGVYYADIEPPPPEEPQFQITWWEPGSRTYERGVDRGVLYFDDGRVVPWNGLTKVDEKMGINSEPVYFDGVKLSEVPTNDGFSAQISAITYPDQLEEAYGNLELRNGIYLGEQAQKAFGFSYRNKLGNELTEDLGYKIHLVYNVTALPSSRSYDTIDDDFNLTEFSWDFLTTPETVTGYQSSAHVVIDTSELTPSLLTEIENILYGTPDNAPYLPPLSELIELISGFNNFINITDNGDGTWTASTAADGYINDLGDGVVEIQEATIQINGPTSYLISPTPDPPSI
jgi:PKD repeat protein